MSSDTCGKSNYGKCNYGKCVYGKCNYGKNSVALAIKCEDNMSLSYESAELTKSKSVPLSPPGGGPLCFKLI